MGSIQVVRGEVVQLKNLGEWLNWIQSLHMADMDLSLERVYEVARRLDLLKPNCPVVTVGGTNGKGSCVAGLESIYLKAGYRVGAFTSPILFRHNEYIRLQGLDVDDNAFCSAFTKIEEARGEITLTQFEFNALAAFEIFKQADLDVWILEVGLGGRFDAVNVIDADVAIVASIGIDHINWLGDTREKIAIEKAGIFRRDKPAVCGDLDPPATLLDCAKKIGAPLYLQTKQFYFEKKITSWDWWTENQKLENLPIPCLLLENMATVLMAIELLQTKLPVNEVAIHAGLQSVSLTGRTQTIFNKTTHVFDVAHNAHAAHILAKTLRDNSVTGKTVAIFSMLEDKDIFATLRVMQDVIDAWHIASLAIKRAASREQLEENFLAAKIDFTTHASIEEAYKNVLKKSTPNDRIVVFGSFHTVAKILTLGHKLCP